MLNMLHATMQTHISYCLQCLWTHKPHLRCITSDVWVLQKSTKFIPLCTAAQNTGCAPPQLTLSLTPVCVRMYV